jgi:putative transposase
MQQRREAVSDLVSQGVSVKAACDAVGLSRASFYRQPMGWCERDAREIEAIQGVLKKAPRSGFWKVYARLRLMGHNFNHERVYRVYCRLSLYLPRRTKRVLPKEAIGSASGGSPAQSPVGALLHA